MNVAISVSTRCLLDLIKKLPVSFESYITSFFISGRTIEGYPGNKTARYLGCLVFIFKDKTPLCSLSS
jgi:hypothetical protein